MRSLIAIGLLVCAGCGFDGIEVEGADAAADPDGNNSVDAGASDAPDDPNDSDGDGVGDSIDNCPDVPNQHQFNEDNDLHGDKCDNCAWVANDNQADGDLDELGDACDPRPNDDDDRLLFFESFARPGGGTLPLSSDSNWILMRGSDTWSMQGGVARQDSSSGVHAIGWAMGTPDEATVVTRLTIDSAPGTGMFSVASASVVGMYTLSPSEDATGCTIGVDAFSISGFHHAFLRINGGATTATDRVTDARLGVGEPTTLMLYFDDTDDGPDGECSATTTTEPPYTGKLSTSILSSSGVGRVALHSEGTTVSYDFIAIIGRDD